MPTHGTKIRGGCTSTGSGAGARAAVLLLDVFVFNGAGTAGPADFPFLEVSGASDVSARHVGQNQLPIRRRRVWPYSAIKSRRNG